MRYFTPYAVIKLSNDNKTSFFKETFPNAVSGSGYLLKSEDLDCMYRRGLETPFVNLEDIFITGNNEWQNENLVKSINLNPKQEDRRTVLI